MHQETPRKSKWIRMIGLGFLVVILISGFSLFADVMGDWGVPASFFMFFVVVVPAYAIYWLVASIMTFSGKTGRGMNFLVINLPVILFGLLVVFIFLINLPPMTKVTLKIIDEQGRGVENARVYFGFKYGRESKTTDQNGVVSAHGFTSNHISPRIEKEGYYSEHISIDVISKDIDEKSSPRIAEDIWPIRRLLPWNPTVTIVLKKK